MHDRNLDPIADLVLEPGGDIHGTREGICWLVGYRMTMGLSRSFRDLIRDALNDGLRVEDRR